ncbi:hypothetical protein COK37_16940 [Bacillus thuringiensis]|nr:hypothetical protein A9489_10720 [Bacillus thuringiensis]SHL59244.1 hypothetical protein SAMN04487918_102625 [Bacillus sp. bc15]PEA61335.1 hypothetical protein CON74_09180 [Bacillus thuringiensis]PEE97623.1 hypothetical protein CON21_27250 [Bacillus thuringiensis]PEV01727.1 hypothetical protein CN417_29580 [Bacillus thuringiensis]
MVLGHPLFVLTRFNLLLLVFFYVLLFDYTSFQAVFFYPALMGSKIPTSFNSSINKKFAFKLERVSPSHPKTKGNSIIQIHIKFQSCLSIH